MRLTTKLFARYTPLTLALLLALPLAAAAEESQFQAHLAAGEFGPARSLALEAETRGQRDRLLVEVARRQAAAGARDAALSTLYDVSDDRVRTRAVDSLRTEPLGPARGGQQVDFESLIELIKSTTGDDNIGPWDTDGGEGTAEGFRGGVYVDASGVLRRISTEDSAALAKLRTRSSRIGTARDVRAQSQLRKVSLVRLERELQMRWARGLGPTEAMKNLAGLSKIQYVMVYPEAGDVVIAGPASDWEPSAEGRSVSTTTGRPVLQLDDLVVVLRNAYSSVPQFGCSITPTQQSLLAAKKYLKETTAKPLPGGEHARDRWVAGLRDAMGRQNIEVDGIDPRTRTAQVLVEADYRMKLVGMGLEEGAAGVPSYLSMVEVDKDGNVPPMNVLRWWFTLNYDSILATKKRDIFQLRGTGVKVLSENELISKLGKRIHTGKSDLHTAQFAHNFTRHFQAMAAKYPIYAELRNIFDLALVANLLRTEDLPGQTGWHMSFLRDRTKYEVPLGHAPSKVESIVNHRLIHDRRIENGRSVKRTHIVVGVSGGVTFDASKLVSTEAIKVDTYGKLSSQHYAGQPQDLKRTDWWWD